MSKWADFSGARPGALHIKHSGIEGVLRYLSAEVPSTLWKRASKAEIRGYLNAGLDVILNYEYYTGRMLEGYNAGFNDGKIAMKQAKAIGYPKGATIYFSHDTSARNDSAVLNYLRGASKAMRGAYEVDIYSGIDVVEKALSAGLARYGWQTLAWSNGRIGRCHIYQNGNMLFGNGADEDIVRHKPLGSWLETKKSNSKPTKKPKPPKKISKPEIAKDVYHVVTKGENLTLLASRYKTTKQSIIALNETKYPSIKKGPNHTLYIGSKLLVIKAARAVSPTKGQPVKIKVTYHTVKNNETLSAIAQHYHTNTHQLVEWNKKAYPSLMHSPDVIYPYWRLKVAVK